MNFHVAYPEKFIATYPDKSTELSVFYKALFGCILEAGHSLKIYPDISLPTPNSRQVTLGYHSRGRQQQTWHIKKSYLRGYFYFDQSGYSGWSDFASSPTLFKLAMQQNKVEAFTFVEELRVNYFNKNISKHLQPNRYLQTDKQPYVFLPLQIINDEVIKLSRFDYCEFARKTAAVLANSPFRLVIKRHPVCSSAEVFKLLAELSKCKHVTITDTAISHLIENAAAVICINSGVGFESLFYYKPIMTGGACDYGYVTKEIMNGEDLENLQQFINIDVDREKIAQFLYFFCQHYLVRFDDRDAIRQRIQMIELEMQNVSIPSEIMSF